jgi:hypothetical protein
MPVLASDPALQSCVDSSFSEWGEGLRKELGARLLVQVRRNQADVQLKLPRALSPTPCMVAWFKAHADAVGSTWTPLDVPLASPTK